MIKPNKLLKSAENVLSAHLNLLGFDLNTSPIKLTISVTNKCNKKCMTCDIWKIYDEDRSSKTTELSLENYRQLFNELDECGLIYIEYTGGEPYLREDIAQIIIESFHRIASLQFIAITTNGYNPKNIVSQTRTMLEEIPPECSIMLGVSIDGDKTLHDEIKGVTGSWLTAIQTLKQARVLAREYSNLRPHISYTFNRINAGRFEESYQSILDQFPVSLDDFSFSIEHSGLLYHNQNSIEIDVEKIGKDLRYLANNPRKTSTLDPVALFRSKSYDKYLEGIIPFINGEKQLRCAAMQLSGYIGPYGNVYPCIMWDKKLGNIRKTSFKEVWRSPLLREYKKLVDIGKCPRCWTPCEVQPSLLINIRKLLFG